MQEIKQSVRVDRATAEKREGGTSVKRGESDIAVEGYIANGITVGGEERKRGFTNPRRPQKRKEKEKNGATGLA